MYLLGKDGHLVEVFRVFLETSVQKNIENR